MAGDTLVTIIGNLTGDAELRFTPSGAAVANFTIASTPRSFDRQSNEWKDGETLFMRCSIWREAAENVVESLTRGTRVIAQGFLKSRSYETKEGEKRTVVECEVQEIGPSLRYATAKVQKAERQQGGQPQGGQGEWGGQVQAGQHAQQSAQQPPPWGQGQQQQQRPPQQGQQQGPPPQQGGWGGGAPSYDEPPF